MKSKLIKYFILIVFTTACASLSYAEEPKTSGSRPNVIIVLIDDIGYGDIGALGNKMVKTPNIDNFYNNSVHFTDYHVMPTCAPTRASLMTGRYTDRVGSWHTIAGRELLFTDETVISQVFSENGYATGLFGKWHLGDEYPFRPMDRGFQEVVCNKGGGIGQTPDYWGNNYFNDTYYHNGHPEKFDGYSTDVFFNQALKFIGKNREKPFFIYLPLPAVHQPLNVPQRYYDMYGNEDNIPENQKRFYGMITNIDDNFKRLRDTLRNLKIEDNTILIFMTDNGTGDGFIEKEGKIFGFNGGMRGQKASPYDGGHRVPFFLSWPGGNIKAARDVNELTSVTDVFPTLVEICGLNFAPKKPLDGKSLIPFFRKQTPKWAKTRVIIGDSQRRQNLVKWDRSYVMQDKWRLVNGRELYNVSDDPGQTNDVSSRFPQLVLKLRADYNIFWQSLMDEGVNERYAYFKVGDDFGPTGYTMITAHDMYTDLTGRAWSQYGVLLGSGTPGIIKLWVASSGEYEIDLRRYPRESGLKINEEVPEYLETNNPRIETPRPAGKNLNLTEAKLVIGTTASGVDGTSKPIGAHDEEVKFSVKISEGKYDMFATLIDGNGRLYPAYYVYVKKIGDF